MTTGNGESKGTTNVTDRELLEVVLEALKQLSEAVEDLTTVVADLREGVSNLSTPGVDFETEFDDD